MVKYFSAALILATTFSGCSHHNFAEVYAKAQTEYVATVGDVADDPTIWVDKNDSQKSLLIGTNKKGGGLEVYTLDGTRVQSLKDGNFNNVDLRYGFLHNDKPTDIVIASNRSDDTLAIYGVNQESHTLFALSLNSLHSVHQSYGLCMFHDGKDFYAITNSQTGEIVMQKIESQNGTVSAKIVGKAKIPTQTEGCVVDDATKTLYVGEEDFGIWQFDLSAGLQNNGLIFDTVEKNSFLESDIEGLAIYNGYLIASSQGNNSYAVYEMKGAKYIGSFVLSSGVIDGTNDTDGIDASSASLGTYKNGIFIAQDGSTSKTQNFKVVDFNDIINGLKLTQDK